MPELMLQSQHRRVRLPASQEQRGASHCPSLTPGHIRPRQKVSAWLTAHRIKKMKYNTEQRYV